ncbi:MAG: GTP cyclohydrolase [Bacteroidota bacterium]
MKTMRKFFHYAFIALLSTAVLTSCDDDDDDDVMPPAEENETETITDVTLLFINGNDTIKASAKDEDDLGPDPLVILDTIRLAVNTTYELNFIIENNIADDPDEVNIAAEIAEEDDEHQFFFGFTDGAFANPTGEGNLEEDDMVNYNDEDSENQDGTGLPVGLSTTWETSANPLMEGFFKVRLAHQPDLKDENSGPDTGESDFDLDFVLEIQ